MLKESEGGLRAGKSLELQEFARTGGSAEASLQEQMLLVALDYLQPWNN